MKNFPISDFEGIGPKKTKDLSKLGIIDTVSLITYFPVSYEDRTKFEFIQDSVKENKQVMLKIKVTGFDNIRTGYKGNILKVNITDGKVNAALICFNRYYLKNSLKPGKEYVLIGKFEFKYNSFQCSNFEIELPGENTFNYSRIVPVYSLTKGITQKILRKLVFQCLEKCLDQSKESLPDYIIKKRNLVSRNNAIINVHFPESFNVLKKAKQRLIYFEFFELYLMLSLKKTFINNKLKNRELKKTKVIDDVKKQLGFKLTNDQNKALEDIFTDINSQHPMSRLLLGDVGCGKTVVATLPAVSYIENGYQTAFMAPTEILAEQHYKTIQSIFKNTDYKVELLTGSLKAKQKQEITGRIENEDVDLVIGTHALFQELVTFKSLAYIVIDEQHRFGVEQRLELTKKAVNPDVLYLSATPIPRSLALTLYGDLSISIIHEKPADRIPVRTQIVNENNLKKIFEFIKQRTLEGEKCYVVYPLIEDSDKIDLKAASVEYDKIKNSYLKGIKCGLVHGRMQTNEREKVMHGFIKGDTSVLFSTTVIEVGVDVPKATVMLIENSHRYGLSTLHQLRGRVGRGKKQSYCFLVLAKDAGENALERMKIMEKSSDGFEIAHKDLEMRGPGEFLGTKQHGILPFRLASLTRDKELFFNAVSDVDEILKQDDKLEKPENYILKETIYKKFMNKYKDFLRS